MNRLDLYGYGSDFVEYERLKMWFVGNRVFHPRHLQATFAKALPKLLKVGSLYHCWGGPKLSCVG